MSAVNQFKNTRRALHAYWRHHATLFQFIDDRLDMPSRELGTTMDWWFAKDTALRRAAATEFVKVTPNSKDKVYHVDEYFMAKCSGFDFRRYDV